MKSSIFNTTEVILSQLKQHQQERLLVSREELVEILMKYNNHSSLYWVWDEEEENLLYMVSTFKSGNRTVTTITNCTKNK